jgi:heme/copper-type cytochrome/quinol oxidase subunit 4
MNTYLLAAIVSVLYGLIRFLEMRFVLKETKPLKFILRDAIIVYLTVMLGVFIVSQLENNMPNMSSAKPEVHIGEADF